MKTKDEKASQDLRDVVREGYTKVARGERTSCCGPASACGDATTADDFACGVGYEAGEVSSLPEGANMGLSCGNPTAIAALNEGEVVLDLGSGGGMDAFLAGPKVGRTGKVIGVDMTPDMIGKARRNVAAYRERTGLDNVEFRLGEIEHLPVADASVDVVMSNCVINLSPDKPAVWREIARVLKPGGRVAVSDLALLRPLPAEVMGMVEALVGCVAGAVLVDETEAMIRAAGLSEVVLKKKPEYVRALQSFEDPLYEKIAEHLPAGTSAADFLTSLDIQARKPVPAKACCG